jgi:hypothetical protein
VVSALVAAALGAGLRAVARPQLSAVGPRVWRACGDSPIAGVLPPGARRTWRVCAPPAARTRLLIEGRGGDIDCYLYGPRGSLVGRDDSDDARCTLEWSPTPRDTYALEVVNTGSSSNAFAAVAR